ncbi:hypothetical protein TVAG_251650 [Trichomonas vaginalis G3]|uniref:Uncharacterized protein n=1 Tax=Trichomonas vaginalis (strain ATCC PRA-98 / G3) TaxID=412133 RepID=A2EF23_TRIV3|nr:EF-hand family [Trichomonas vaginalis G3]EAY08739.1 hypothetical protein TVAG_251650 [Trichomonas vaginalis G3]KAI5507148.1 EF-hand family [Trichomonas vaginalis G3]|eukprot:XP_001320962.1 hypothetical protein [Trichomonas vaginalis G3]
MTEGIRRRQTLQQIQSRIKSLGTSDWNIWNMFSTEDNLSIEQFSSRIYALGFEVSQQDIAILWRAVGITSNTMTYNDFIRFLQYQGSESNNNLNLSLNDRLRSNAREFLNKFLESDQNASGLVTYRIFNEIGDYFSIPKSEIQDMIDRYDDEGTGYIKYFKLISDICYSKNDIPTPKFSAPPLEIPPSPHRINDDLQRNQNSSPNKSRRSTYDPTPTSSPYRQYSSERNDSFEYSPERRSEDYSPNSVHSPYRDFPSANSSPNMSPSGRRLDPSIFGQFSPKSPSSPSFGGRDKLDPSIFGQYSPKSPSSPSSGGRGKLDPSIFGEKPVIMTSEQPEFNADECTNCERLNNLPPKELVKIISQQVSKFFRGGKQAFSKWRGKSEYLDVEDIRNGIARDTNILVQRRDLQEIIKIYGGPFNLSSFVRMLSDGSSYSESRNRDVTEGEAAISRIASQIRNDSWEDVVIRARNAQEMCRGFKEIGMRVSESDIQNLMQKLGRSGFINAIRSKLD